MAVRGDFNRLTSLIEQARLIASVQFRMNVLKNLAEAARTEIVLGFATSTDPYGNRWAPLKAKPGSRRYGGQPLRDRGILQNSFNVEPTATGILIRAVIYAGFHQYGTRRMVARRMVPVDNNLGPRWRRSFYRVIETQLTLASKRR